MTATQASVPRIDSDVTAIMNHSGGNKTKKKFNWSEGIIGERLFTKPVSYCNTIFDILGNSRFLGRTYMRRL